LRLLFALSVRLTAANSGFSMELDEKRVKK
jgi:hypothetical protein